ncbi:MAG: glycosyltransferase [Pseudomonadota bacterium]
MTIQFSIVINTYNRAHTIEDTLQSLKYLRYPSFEVLVVNGPSTDATEEILKRYRDDIIHLNCSEANLSVSRNIGISAASGDVVCFIDDDAIPEPNWLDMIATGYTSPEVGAVGGYIRDHTGYSYQSRAVVCNRFGEGVNYESPDAVKLKTSTTSPPEFYSLTGTNCTFRRSALFEIGGFDEEYAYFLDETDVVLRLVDRGYKIVYVPSAEIHHKYASSHLRTATRIPTSIYLPARSKAYFCMKNAAPVHGSAIVLDHLEKYRSSLRSDYDWYLHHGQIDVHHHRNLHQGIDRGISDGLRNAFLDRKLMNRERSDTKQSFKAYPPTLAAPTRIRVCFLSQEYPPNPCGGIGNWTHTLATSLARLGHEVTVITKGAEHNRVDFQEGVWVHRVVPVWQPERTVPPIPPDIPQITKDYAYTVYDEVMRIRLVRGIDLVSSPIWDLEGIACIADVELINVLSLHTTFRLALPSKPDWANNAEYKKNHIDKIIEGEKWLLENSRYILANSNAIVADVIREYEVNLTRSSPFVIPHGIAPIDKSLEIRGISFETNDDVNILYVGRFERRKGIDLLLDCLPELLEKNSNLTVTLVGDNELLDGKNSIWSSFVERHKNSSWFGRVLATGRVDSDSLSKYYSSCDVFVAPSRYESFGLIFVEAMRFAKVCVGTKVGGIPEVIEDQVNGILCDSDNVDQLRLALESLIVDKNKRDRLGMAGYKSFTENFIAEKMAASCLDMYRNIRKDCAAT